MTHSKSLSIKTILFFWLPLAATWLIISIEGPYLNTVIARLPNPKINLGAFGVAISFLLIMTSPGFMMMGASTALVKDRESFIKLRNFLYVLMLLLQVIFLLLLYPPIYRMITDNLMELPPAVADLAHVATCFLAPLPTTTSYRRFLQGILITQGLTRRVAIGTTVRLFGMVISAALLSYLSSWPGAVLATAAMFSGMIMEVVAIRLMVHTSLKRLAKTEKEQTDESLTYSDIIHFYLPLALTCIIAMAIGPCITFFLAKASKPIESLAVYPVVSSLVFIFIGIYIAMQEVIITLLGKQHQHIKEIKKFACWIGGIGFISLHILAFTPLAHYLFKYVYGLAPDLIPYAILATRIMATLPIITLCSVWQRSVLMHEKKTTPITGAVAVELTLVASCMYFLIKYTGLAGVTIGAIAHILGRAGVVAFLYPYYSKVRARFIANLD